MKEAVMEVAANKIRRIVCPDCGNYYNICSHDSCPGKRHCQDKVCGSCGREITPDFRQVPWWYGRDVPKHAIFWWLGKYKKEGRRVTEIPESFLEVNIWLAGQEGRQITKEQAIEYFKGEAREEFSNAEVLVVSNEEWGEITPIKCPVSW